MATPTANSSGISWKRASPAVPMTPATGSIQPSPPTSARSPASAPLLPSMSPWPRRSRIAAAGSTAMGIIKLRPMRCSTPRMVEDEPPAGGLPVAAEVELTGSSQFIRVGWVRTRGRVRGGAGRWSGSARASGVEAGVQRVAVRPVPRRRQLDAASVGEAAAPHRQHGAAAWQAEQFGVGGVADSGLDGLLAGVQDDPVLLLQDLVQGATR